MAGLYQNWIAPTLLDWSMRSQRLVAFRSRVVSAAEGRVLEIGIGSGLNLPFYAAQARQIFGLDPSTALLARARRKASPAQSRVQFLAGSAERIPLDAGSVDTVVMTWVGCSIPDIALALDEIRRVLRPGGHLLFVEHGRAPQQRIARWQDRLDPLWTRIAGGCHINRSPDVLIRQAGLRIDRLETGYIPGPKITTFLYEGSATAACVAPKKAIAPR
jgi:ubiquinone/menaquinone biosynthesis C-methylase UbiE